MPFVFAQARSQSMGVRLFVGMTVGGVFVIVNRATKASLLDAAAHLRKAPEEAAARDAWEGFMATSGALLHSE